MIVAVVGPSGAGKDTLLEALLKDHPEMVLVRRVITRPAEAGGEAFEGVTNTDFAARKSRGDFALDWEAHGLFYGIETAQLDLGKTVIFNGSRGALTHAKQVFPDLKVIVVTAPQPVLAQRLAARGRESGADIERRLTRAQYRLPEGISAQTVINDGTVAQGVAQLVALLQDAKA
jgi:ribose 1,5-bisphosphokinase